MATVTTTTAPGEQSEQQPWDYSLRKYLLLLATIVATVTYSAGFTPPGGVWQEAVEGHHRAGDAIIREISYVRYLVFFYCNASAFASSLLVVALILLIGVLQTWPIITFERLALRAVMVLDLFSLIMAYAAGTCRDTFTEVYSCSLLAVSAVAYLILQAVLSCFPPSGSDDSRAALKEKSRKIMLLLSTFAVSLTYTAGLNTPGGFWDNPKDADHHPGDAILKEHHQARLAVFFVCNTTAFVASLFTILLLLDKKLHKTGAASCVLYGCIVAALLSLIGAYAAGSSRERATTTYVVSLVAAVLLCILLLLAIVKRFGPYRKKASVRLGKPQPTASFGLPREEESVGIGEHREEQPNDAVEKAPSLVLLLATLAATITYQAGLHPPGGIWQETVDGHHIAGDPILLTTKPGRYKAFFYCNSLAFVASLVAIVLVQNKQLVMYHVLEAAMLLDLFGLIGAYAAGACRDVSTSIYVIAMAGVVLVYVLLHVIYFTSHVPRNTSHPRKECDCDEKVEKRRKRLLLFAILAATISYQAGLTPPGGFLLRDDDSTGRHAGYPILLYNSVRRYTAFFYCNSASFMLSMALNILLVNPNVYKPAIQSYALFVCTVVGLFGLVGAYAVGSTLRKSTSISIIVMAAVVLLVMLLLLIVSMVKGVKNANEAKEVKNTNETTGTAATTTDAATATAAAPMIGTEEDQKKKLKKKHAKRKYLMLIGILVASMTYQAGLDQPGGVWQSTTLDHNAGNPVMQDNRGRRYHVFFYCNSTAFMASIIIIILLLLRIGGLHKRGWWLRVMNTTVLLDLLALLGAYAVGSSRDRKTSTYVAMLVVPVLAYVVVHWMLSSQERRPADCSPSSSHANGETPSNLVV